MRFRLLTLLVWCSLTAGAVKTVSISNLRPRTDLNGRVVDVHNGCMCQYDSVFYWYGTSSGTAFAPAETSLSCYRSTDMTSWKQVQILFKKKPVGTVSRPCIVYHSKTKKYLLWYRVQKQGAFGQLGVAMASTPTGPFEPVSSDVKLRYSADGVSDFSLFVDDDLTAYVLYSSGNEHRCSVEKLAADYRSSTLENGGFQTVETQAGSMFKRQGKYYLITGAYGPFNPQGTGADVYVSNQPMRGFVHRNDINRFPGTPAPMLTDGVLSPNLYTTIRKNSDGAFSPIQIELPGDSVFNTLKLIQFTGNRKAVVADSMVLPTFDPLSTPSFEIQYWKNGYWIPIRVTERAVTSSVYTLLVLQMETIKARRIRILTARSYPNSLMLNEIELSDKQRKVSDGAQAFVVDQPTERCRLQVPAQQTCIMPLQTADGLRYLWMADLWGSASDNVNGHDDQYWSAPLEFDPKGDIEPLKWVDSWRVNIP